MARFQLEVGLFLCACSLLSLLFFALDWKRGREEGHIQLPLHDDGEEELDGGTSQNDPFPITKPVDMLDGYPIREDDFWREVRSSRVLYRSTSCLIIVDASSKGVAVDHHVCFGRCAIRCTWLGSSCRRERAGHCARIRDVDFRILHPHLVSVVRFVVPSTIALESDNSPLHPHYDGVHTSLLVRDHAFECAPGEYPEDFVVHVTCACVLGVLDIFQNKTRPEIALSFERHLFGENIGRNNDDRRRQRLRYNR